MPIHDWKRVKNLGLFHHFHQSWIIRLCEALNAGVLPDGYFALAEQRIPDREADVLALRSPNSSVPGNGGRSGLAVAASLPQTRFVRRLEDDATAYARKADRIAVRDGEGVKVAVIEIVSPGNKSSQMALQSFVKKAIEMFEQRIHLLVVDLFPPTARDPSGMHKAIWDEVQEETFDLPADKPLTLVSYDSGPPCAAYIEPVAVGDFLPDMPLFLSPDRFVSTPLETTYMGAFMASPLPLREAVDPPN